MSRPDRELEALLRQSLAEEAARVQPAGDGLARIRARTDRRRGWERWRVPALALAGTAALLAAIVAAPKVLPGLNTGPGLTPAAPRSSAPAGVTASPARPTPAVGTPIAGAGVNDMPTVWPYPSRRVGFEQAERDVAAGRYPDLTRPDRVAVTFVESYVGSGSGLTAVSAGRWKAGLRMEVRRGGQSVSLVYLVRVRVGNDAPYVVVDAARPGPPSLTLDRPPALGGTPLRVGGTVRRHPGDAAPAITVQLRDPGADAPLATARATVTGLGEDRAWSASLAPAGAAAGTTAAVAAWTSDPSGEVAEFVAAPTAP